MTGKSKALLVALIGVGCSSVVLLGPSARWWNLAPRDYEECVEEARNTLDDEQARLMTRCGERFAARRKNGGGYTYYDFMQNRSFDIAGPTLSQEELKYIDHEYIGYLATERQKAIAAELANKQNEQLKADLEKVEQPNDPTASVGRPLVITPNNPVASGPKNVGRLKATSCNDDSLACSWSKLSNRLKDAFNADAQKP